MIAAAAAEHLVRLTRFDAALPFLVAAVLALIGAISSDFVTDKVASVLRLWAQQAGQSVERLPYAFRPEQIAQMSGWTIDAGQTLATILAPFVGLVLLIHLGATSTLVLANLVILLIAFLVFWFFWRRPPDAYANRWPLFLTPLTALAVGLNIIGAAIAYLIGP